MYICSYLLLVQNEYVLLVFVFLTGLSVRISPKTFTQYRGQNVVFYCYVTGNPAPIVSWYSQGRDITRDSRVTITNIPRGYLMRLGPVHLVLDNGTLECRGNNAVDRPVADKAELHVLSRNFRKFSSPLHYIFQTISRNEEVFLSPCAFNTYTNALLSLKIFGSSFAKFIFVLDFYDVLFYIYTRRFVDCDSNFDVRKLVHIP